jgi:sugar phosphate permease
MTELSSGAPRRGWYHGWNIVVACILAQAVSNGLPVNSYSLFLKDWSVDLHTQISSLQLAMASLGLVSALVSPFVGGLADKYPARLMMGGGLLGIAAFCIGVSFVTANWQLLALYAVLLPLSISFGTSLPGNACISRWFVRRLGLALGLAAFGLGLAGVILPPIIANLLPEIGWRLVWRYAGLAVVLLVVPVVVWAMRDRPSARDGLDYLTGDGAAPAQQIHGHGAPSGGGRQLSSRNILSNRNFWLLIGAYIPMMAVYGVCLQNMGPIAESRALSTQTAGALLSAIAATQVISTLLAGLLSDRFGNRLPLAGMGLFTAIGGIFVAYGHDAIMMGCGVLLVGFSGGLWPLLAAAAAREFGAGNMGRAFGHIMLFLPVMVLVPFVVAKLYESTGSYVPSLLGLSAICCAGAVALLLFMRERDRGAPEVQATPSVASA